jgi:hypothetical protein
MPTIGNFIEAVRKIDNHGDAREFFREQLQEIRAARGAEARKAADPHAFDMQLVHGLQYDIGWCFGEGMPLARRQMWSEAVGAVHPVAGPEYATRDFTAREMFQAGVDYVKKNGTRPPSIQERRSSWDRVLKDPIGED